MKLVAILEAGRQDFLDATRDISPESGYALAVHSRVP